MQDIKLNFELSDDDDLDELNNSNDLDLDHHSSVRINEDVKER